ncbi:hypothetical protein [Dermatobacter hominis]|uniref:hypothetical protein n=1 Tax=Dermatobacter hominis TaxID=2884263 RepID=UPI001D10AB3A|nr:hypothetical protein [Dermatobacter hominis]UDY35734.1 hypothetical protein LH044_20720 [Dermatobacter hominis]
MKRFLAVLAAVAMVGGAWWIRQHVIDGDDGGGVGERVRLRCGTELRAVCQRLADEDGSITISVEDEGTTADQLAAPGATANFDAWLAAGPWAAIVADDRRQADVDDDVLGPPTKVLARSPVTLVGPADRMQALGAHCGGTVTWACIGDASGQPWAAIGGQPTWGPFRSGLAPPDTGAGLVALSQAVSSHVGTAAWDRLDLEESSPWLGQLVGAAVVDRDPLSVLLTRPGTMSVVGPLEQQSGPELAAAAVRDRYALLYPEPMVTADVTLTAPAGRDAADALDRIGPDRLAEALAAEGWRVPGQQTADGVDGPALPDGPGLPSAGALQALRDEWAVLRP